MARDVLAQLSWGLLLLLGTAIAAPATGLAQTCGDLSMAGGEECDDGNAFGGDGCAANCTLAPRAASMRGGWVAAICRPARWSERLRRPNARAVLAPT